MDKQIFKMISESLLENLTSKFFEGHKLRLVIFNEGEKNEISEGNEIEVEIIIEGDKVVDYQFYIKNNYLSEDLNFITYEIEQRGMTNSIEEIRLRIIDEFKYLSISSLEVKDVLNFTKALLFFEKVTKFIFKNLKIPKGLWHSKSLDEENWQNYLHIKPKTAGLLDGLIDEITPIATSIFYIYELCFVDGREEQILNVLESDLYYNLKLEYEDEFPDDDEERSHKAMQTIISVSALYDKSTFENL